MLGATESASRALSFVCPQHTHPSSLGTNSTLVVNSRRCRGWPSIRVAPTLSKLLAQARSFIWCLHPKACDCKVYVRSSVGAAALRKTMLASTTSSGNVDTECN
ncbi:unnamed protein product [Ixodes pacificus]